MVCDGRFDGPYDAIPDGSLSEDDLNLGLSACLEFEVKTWPTLGKMKALVGHSQELRAKMASGLANEIEEMATSVWRDAFCCEPNWPQGKFAAETVEILSHVADDPSFHFGDAELKELKIAHAYDLVGQMLSIQVFGGRHDALKMQHELGIIKRRRSAAGIRDRAILGGAKPFSDPVDHSFSVRKPGPSGPG